ncbi:MAG TPA: methyltransferase domain-containing protein [Thermoanaerobaculia bacterium]|nr:methyltransferase domain-containing protein [Thermoanaerobaculia bacterium]
MSSYYLLGGEPSERERLRLQSLVWEPASRALFDAIPVQRGWRCADVGCGALGVLRALAERTGAEGEVIGYDVDETLLASARDFLATESLDPIARVEQRDLFAGELPREAFDLVHMRFMLAPIGRESELLTRALELCKPGGVFVSQEPDSASWSLLPPFGAFDRLRQIILAAFRAGGGDFDAGRRTFALLRDHGLENVSVRAAIEALPLGHPYLRVVIQFATALRKRILEHGLATAVELDALTADVEQALASRAGTTFVVTQVWGTKPAHS